MYPLIRQLSPNVTEERYLHFLDDMLAEHVERFDQGERAGLLRLDLDRFVSETIALDQVEEAFHRMERGEVLRSVVVIGDRAVG